MTTKRVTTAQLGRRMRRAPVQRGNPGVWHWGIVVSVDGTGPQSLTCTIDGDTDNPQSLMPFMDYYTPAPADKVLILEIVGESRGEWMVMGAQAT